MVNTYTRWGREKKQARVKVPLKERRSPQKEGRENGKNTGLNLLPQQETGQLPPVEAVKNGTLRGILISTTGKKTSMLGNKNKHETHHQQD